jgi:hypothetical protein
MGAAGQATAATLTHAYDFSSSSGGQVFDSVGSVDGTLIGGATVGGGVLSLTGSGDGVDFANYLLPSGVYDFSVYLRLQGDPNLGTYTEIISQNSSGAPGFYIGTQPGGNFRLGDSNPFTGVAFPSGSAFHDLLLTSSSIGGLKFSIDGTVVYTGSQMSIGSGGDYTRLGRQFNAHGENFDGQVDTLKIFSGVATMADVSGAPEPAAWLLMILGMGGVGATLRRARRALAAA